MTTFLECERRSSESQNPSQDDKIFLWCERSALRYFGWDDNLFLELLRRIV